MLNFDSNLIVLTKNSCRNNPSQVCPFLLRVFFCEGRHHSLAEYTNKTRPPITEELQIYTWFDATLSELMGLIRKLPNYRDRGTQFSYSIVFPEPSAPTYRMRHVGVTIGGKRGPDDDKTLGECRLQIGDYIDVAILPTGADITRIKNDQRVNKKNRRFRPGNPATADFRHILGRFQH